MLTLLRTRPFPVRLLTNLTSYWTLDEASGARADSHGGISLTDNNTVTQTTGKIGNAAVFDAANSEYLSAADNATLRVFGTSWTIAFWFYPVAISGTQALVYKGPGTGSLVEYGIRLNGGNQFALIRGDGTTSTTVTTTNVAPPGQWSHGVAWFDLATNLSGVQLNNSAPVLGTGREVNGANLFAIGRSGAASSGYFTGRIDEVALWKRALNPTERAYLYNNGAGRSYAAIQATA